MKNPTRWIVALIMATFLTGIISSTPASAHHPELEGSVTRPCGEQSEWSGTFTATADAVRGKEWRSEYKVGPAAWSSESSWQPDASAFGPIDVGPFPAGVASVTIQVRSDWRPSGPTNQTRSITLNRPEAYACPTTTTSTSTTSTSTTTTTVPVTSTSTSTTVAPPTTVEETTTTTSTSSPSTTSTPSSTLPVPSTTATVPPTTTPSSPSTQPSLPPTPVPTPPANCPLPLVPSDIGFCIPPSTSTHPPAERITTTTITPSLPVTGGSTDMGLFLGTLALFGGGFLTLIARRKATS